jgi:hypothetical protein
MIRKVSMIMMGVVMGITATLLITADNAGDGARNNSCVEFGLFPVAMGVEIGGAGDGALKT